MKNWAVSLQNFKRWDFNLLTKYTVQSWLDSSAAVRSSVVVVVGQVHAVVSDIDQHSPRSPSLVMSETGETNDIRDSFRRFYRTFESALRAIAARTDPDPPLEPEELANLGDQLDEFIRLLNQVHS